MLELDPFFSYFIDHITIKNSLKSITPFPSRSTTLTKSLISSVDFTKPKAKNGSSRSYTVMYPKL